MQKEKTIKERIPSISEYITVTQYFAELRGPIASSTLPLVSIVTIVKNQPTELLATIESVQAQDYPNLEHIIINGGDTIAVQARSLLMLTEPDLGIADAFNKGVAGAAGDIVCILNAGDLYLEGAITEIVSQFNQQPETEIICCSAAYIEANRTIYYRRSDDLRLLYSMSVVHPATFVLKKVYQEIGLFCLAFSISMDYEFLLRAKKNKIKFSSLDLELVEVLTNGISEQDWRSGLVQSFKAKRLNGFNSPSVYLYGGYDYIFQTIYSILKKMKLSYCINFYRKYFSSLSYLKK